MSGSDLRGSSLVGADFSGALLFGIDLEDTIVWYTVPSIPVSYTLGRLEKIHLAIPEADIFERLAKVADDLRSITGSRESRFTVLNKDTFDHWALSEEYQGWRAAISSESKKPKEALNSESGRYMGDLACNNIVVLQASISRYLPGSYEFYDSTFQEYQAVPPGVSEKDLEQLRPRFFGSGTLYYANYSVYPGYLAAFYKRISESDCSARQFVSRYDLDQLTLHSETLAKETGKSQVPKDQHTE